MNSFELRVSDGIGWLVFNDPNEKVNKLTSNNLRAFSNHLDQIRCRSDIRILVIISGKPDCFIAGADINEIRAIYDAEDGKAKAKMGQAICTQLAEFPIPTIAAIHGAALGGGLELALACTYRIVSDHAKTILGLPEVNLGIIPGFGGTVRLPRLIRLHDAVMMIVTGGSVTGQKAEKSGLADRCVADGFFKDEVTRFANSLLTDSGKRAIKVCRESKRSWIDRMPFGSTFIFSMAQKSVLLKTGGRYPAPLAAIASIKHGVKRSIPEALDGEARYFSQLVTTSVSKNLIGLYFLTETLKKDSGIGAQMEFKTIQSAGVLGAGLRGGGIAQLIAAQGIPVRLKDVSWDAVRVAYQSAVKVLQKLVNQKKISRNESDLVMQRFSATTDYVGFGSVDIMVEAVVENLSVKQTVLSEIEAVVGPDTILVSNTSALSITEMGRGLRCPNRFAGMHFFSPVHRMPLVEVIRGEATDDQTIATVVQFAKLLKKTPIVVKNGPGFLVNRLLIPYVNEAVRLLEEGVAIQTVDSIMTAFGMPLGPLALADEVGLDVGYKVAKILHDGLGDRMTVADSFERINQIDQLKGKKSGLGFYRHENGGSTPNADIESVLVKKAGGPPSRDDCLDRLVLTMVNEAARCVDEGVVASAGHLDLAMVMGTGFPPYRMGLCRYADEVGIARVVDRLHELAQRYGDRFSPCQRLVDMAARSDSFYKI